MARPRVGNEKSVKFSLTLDKAMLRRLDALTARLQAAMPYGKIDRSQTTREALARGLAQLEAETAPKRTARKGATTAAD